jgi:hypothetical protein
MQLAEECCSEGLEAEFLTQLAKAKSNLPEFGDGAQIYQKLVKPAFIDIERVAGHYAISSLFENYGEKTRVYCYDVERENYSVEAEGKMRLATGLARFRSEITLEVADLFFAVLHLGDHNITAGVRHRNGTSDSDFQQRLLEVFAQADTAEAIRLLDQAFEKNTFSLRLLFRDEQRKITTSILNDSLASAAAVYRTIFESQAPLIRFLHGLSIPVPHALMAAAEIALNYQLQQLLDRPEIDFDGILSLVKEAASGNVPLDTTTLEYAIRRRIEKEATEFVANPSDSAISERLRRSLDLIPALPFPVVLWEAQNICYPAIIRMFEENGSARGSNEIASQQHLDNLARLAAQLQIRVPQVELQT